MVPVAVLIEEPVGRQMGSKPRRSNRLYPLNNLPYELWIYVLKFVDLHTLTLLMDCSQRWRKFILASHFLFPSHCLTSTFPRMYLQVENIRGLKRMIREQRGKERFAAFWRSVPRKNTLVSLRSMELAPSSPLASWWVEAIRPYFVCKEYVLFGASMFNITTKRRHPVSREDAVLMQTARWTLIGGFDEPQTLSVYSRKSSHWDHPWVISPLHEDNLHAQMFSISGNYMMVFCGNECEACNVVYDLASRSVIPIAKSSSFPTNIEGFGFQLSHSRVELLALDIASASNPVLKTLFIPSQFSGCSIQLKQGTNSSMAIALVSPTTASSWFATALDSTEYTKPLSKSDLDLVCYTGKATPQSTCLVVFDVTAAGVMVERWRRAYQSPERHFTHVFISQSILVAVTDVHIHLLDLPSGRQVGRSLRLPGTQPCIIQVSECEFLLQCWMSDKNHALNLYQIEYKSLKTSEGYKCELVPCWKSPFVSKDIRISEDATSFCYHNQTSSKPRAWHCYEIV